MDDPKNQAQIDQAERDKADGNLREGGEGQPVAGGLTKEEKGDQTGGGDAGDSGDAGDDE